MATICYFPSSGAADVSPTPSATDWDLHVNTVSRPLEFTRGGSATATVIYNPDAADHLVDGNSMNSQFVSQILPPQAIAAQQIACGFRAIEAQATNNLFPCFKIYGCNVAGSSNLGNIVPFFRSAVTELSSADRGVCEAFVGSAVTFNEPWRLVVELGAGGLPVAGAGVDSHNATFTFGSPLTTGALNLPQNTVTGVITAVLLFSNDIITSFGGPIARYVSGIEHT
jgi:hypothetical protein